MEYSKKYHNCLRLQITNDNLCDERIEDLAEHCTKYGFDNVMLMINAEEFNVGHITLEQAAPWIAVLKKAKERLEADGISVSINNWIEIGHLDRGRTLQNGQNFVNMTDMNGKTTTLVACPMGEEWRKYFIEYAKLITRELQPDTFWIEDDFRLHNHEPLVGIGCYCKNHMAYFNSRLKTNYTREEFVNKIFAKGPCNPERKLWFEANRDVMIELAAKIRNAVKSVKPDTDLAIMSSAPQSHCIEARDWDRLFTALNGENGKKINRIHLKYEEGNGKAYIYYFNSVSMAVRAMTDDDVIVMPETEHSSSNLYRKGARYLRFSLQASTPLVLSGMTYSLYGFEGSGVRDSFGFGQVVKDLQPFMQKLMEIQPKFSSLQGVVVPIDPNASLHREINTSYTDLEPREYHAAAYLSGLGAAYRYSREKSFENQTVFLTASSAVCFTDAQLKELFKNNFVIIDGGATIELEKRGLLGLIHAQSATVIPMDSGYHSYEECADPVLRIDGVRKMRTSCRRDAYGDFVQIEYDNNAVEVKSHVFDHNAKLLAPAIVSGDGFLVLPYFIDRERVSLFGDLQRHFILEAVKAHTPKHAVCDVLGVSPYLYTEDNRAVMIVSNGQFDNYSEIEMVIGGFEFSKVLRIGDDGQLSEVKYKLSDGHLKLDTPLEYLSSAALIFE